MCDVTVSEACDTFILSIVNRPSNAVPKFASDGWCIWEVSETQVSQTYLNATKIMMNEKDFIPRLMYVLKNMWPVECENIVIKAFHDDDYGTITVVKI